MGLFQSKLLKLLKDGDTEINIKDIKKIIREGKYLNSKDQNGNTPLHYASIHGLKDVVSLLLKHGAKVNSKNEYGNTPLHQAAFLNHEFIVNELIAAGATINAENYFDQLPVHTVTQSIAPEPNVNILNKLIQNGANIYAVDSYGNTPLHYAAEANNIEDVKLLLKEGSIVDKENSEGKKPIDLTDDEEIKKFIGIFNKELSKIRKTKIINSMTNDYKISKKITNYIYNSTLNRMEGGYNSHKTESSNLFE